MSDDFDRLLAEVSGTVQNELETDAPQPDFEAMMARAASLAEQDSDPAFDGFTQEVAAHLDGDTRAVPSPDFLAVVARAHAIDANAVPKAAVDEVQGYAPIIALDEVARRRRTLSDPDLDNFVRDVRGHLDHGLAREHADAEQPAAPARIASRRGWLAAAGLLLAIGLGASAATLFDLRGNTLWGAEDDAANEAMLSPRPAAERETEQARQGERPRPSRLEPQPEPEPEPEPESDTLPEPLPPEDAAPAPAKPTKSRRRAGPSRRERLAALEREANLAWKEGRLDDAASAFRRITDLDRRGSWGESAFGELFTLQRQRGGSSVSLWKTYLKRFPSGRFADDARAGLCRRAKGQAKVACWTDYLDAMPRGSFRAQAQRELAQSAEDPTP